jgi:hypothetical protein
MGSEYLKKRLSFMSRYRPVIRVAATVMTTVTLLVLSTVVRAETDLDDVTMRVIGLDEIPTHSLQIIELPQADLGELADINESLVPGAAESPVSPADEVADTITTPGPPVEPPPGEVTSGPQAGQ